jgi:hypothetical protein
MQKLLALDVAVARVPIGFYLMVDDVVPVCEGVPGQLEHRLWVDCHKLPQDTDGDGVAVVNYSNVAATRYPDYWRRQQLQLELELRLILLGFVLNMGAVVVVVVVAAADGVVVAAAGGVVVEQTNVRM